VKTVSLPRVVGVEDGFCAMVDCPVLAEYVLEVINEREVEEGSIGYDRSGIVCESPGLIFESPAGLQYFNFNPVK
jgi:hypothetical protein